MGNCKSRKKTVNAIGINTYENVKILNQGTFCNTFLVKKGDKLFVNKKYRKSGEYIILNDHSFFSIDIVNNEIEILTSLSHPCILKFYEYLENKNTISIITPYIHGESLQNCAPKIITENQIRWIVYQLLSTLTYLTRKCIIHRDIKPHNIIIGDNNYLTLIDYNCSEFVHQPNEIEFGTYGYKAPEIHYNMKYSFNSDIFSMGCVIYYIIYKKVPLSKNIYSIPLVEWPYISFPKSLYSINAINFVRNCVIYNREKRYTVRDCYIHRWMFDYIINLSETNLLDNSDV